MTGKVIFALFLLLAFLFAAPMLVSAQVWQYPLEKSLERASYKSFGQYFDKNSYLGKENLFPNQFVGFHAGTDLEIFPEELNTDVSVFAVGNGTITFVGSISGYGGLILEKFDNFDLTALYGHIKLSSIKIKAGDKVQTEQTLAFLGGTFSSETGGERKHLHFGIYKGHDLYFKGYDNTQSQLDQRWIDPMQFLQTKVLNISPTATPIISSETIAPNSTTQIIQNNPNFFQTIWNWIKNMLHLKS